MKKSSLWRRARLKVKQKKRGMRGKALSKNIARPWIGVIGSVGGCCNQYCVAVFWSQKRLVGEVC